MELATGSVEGAGTSYPHALHAGFNVRDYPVLYVDDEEANLLVFRAAFSDDFAIHVASSGDEALLLMEQHHMAILLTDERMPKMSGIDLCARVRRAHPHVRRVLVTAFSDQGTAIDAINRGGVHAYLMKPWNPDDVRHVLMEAIHTAHLERVVHSMRSAVAQKERQLGVASMRARIVNSLEIVTSTLSSSSTFLAGFLPELERHLPADVYARARPEIEYVQKSLGYIARLQEQHRGLEVAGERRAELLPIHEVIQTVELLIGQDLRRAAQLLFNYPRDATVWADRVNLTQILLNLLTNAKEALERQGSKQGSRTGRVRIDTAVESGRVIIEVADDGPGVPPDKREAVFEELYTTKEGTGSGLGLSIARALAEASGGTLEVVDSTRLPGATLRLTLPARTE